MAKPPIVIIGAGPTGLISGRFLPGSVIYEKSACAGGLARSIRHNGFVFDIGFHFLGPLDPEAIEFLSVTGNRFQRFELKKEDIGIARDGRIWRGLAGPADISLQSDPCLAVATRLSYFIRRVFPKKEETLFDAAVNRYGDLYFHLFFKKVTQKIWGPFSSQIVTPRQADGSVTPRELLVKRLMRRLRKSSSTQKKQGTPLLYPIPSFGSLSEKFAQGLDIRFNSSLTRIFFTGNRISGIEINGGEKIPCEHLVLAIPPYPLITLFDPSQEILQQRSALQERDLILVVLFFDADHILDEQLLYSYGDELFFRAYEPKSFSAEAGPEGKTVICFEIYGTNSLADEEIKTRTLKDLQRYYAVPAPFDALVLRFPRAWPVFDKDFYTIARSMDQFLSRFENVHILHNAQTIAHGNRMNSVIKEVARIAQEILSS